MSRLMPVVATNYCTITTLGSRGVTCDGRERYQTKFIGEIFVWQDLNRFTFYSKRASKAQQNLRPGIQ